MVTASLRNTNESGHIIKIVMKTTALLLILMKTIVLQKKRAKQTMLITSGHCQREEPQANSDDEPVALTSSVMCRKTCLIKTKQTMPTNISCFTCQRRRSAPVFQKTHLYQAIYDSARYGRLSKRLHKSMNFLIVHDSLLKFVEKRVSQCMEPLFRIQDDMDKVHEDSMSMEIKNKVANLLEKTFLSDWSSEQ